MNTMQQYETAWEKKNIPDFRIGDALKVTLRIREGEAQRSQVFEGVVIARRGQGLSEMFTVRKTSFSVGVERSIPIHSPTIEKIQLVRSGKVRRAKLYYLRDRAGKAARLEEKTVRTDAGIAPATPAAPKAEPAPAAPAAAPTKTA